MAYAIGIVLGSALTSLLVALLLEWVLLRRIDPDSLTGSLVRGLLRALGVLGGLTVGLVASGLVEAPELVRSVRATAQAELFEIAGTSISLATVVTLFAVLVLAWWISRALQRAFRRTLQARQVVDDGTLLVVERLIHYVVMLLGFVAALQTAGVNLSGLLAAGAVFAVGVGLAMQGIAENFVSGLILLIERAIKPGDVLEVEGETVRVVRMGIRSTVCRSLDDDEIIVPNTTLAQGKVRNMTMSDTVHRVRVVVGVHYRSDVPAVISALEGAGRAVQASDAPRDPVVLFHDFGASSLDFELSVWVRDPWRLRQYSSSMRLEIWKALKAADIEIAFPQLDVHLDEPVERSLTALSGG